VGLILLSDTEAGVSRTLFGLSCWSTSGVLETRKILGASVGTEGGGEDGGVDAMTETLSPVPLALTHAFRSLS